MALSPGARFPLPRRPMIKVEAELASRTYGFGANAHCIVAVRAFEPRGAVEHLQLRSHSPIPNDFPVVPAFHENPQGKALTSHPIPDQIMGPLCGGHVNHVLHAATLAGPGRPG